MASLPSGNKHRMLFLFSEDLVHTPQPRVWERQESAASLGITYLPCGRSSFFLLGINEQTWHSDGVLWRREGLSVLRYLVYFSSFPQGDLQHPNYIFHPNYFSGGLSMKLTTPSNSRQANSLKYKNTQLA